MTTSTQRATPGPAVSVLMPVAAPAPFLDQALVSLTEQTLTDWQLVLVVDGPSALIVRQAQALVPARQLVIVELPQRLGVAGALNAGLLWCGGALVARLDADDRSHRDRLETQAGFLRERVDVGLVGSHARLVDERGRPCGERGMPARADLRAALARRNRFVHSSVMFRRDLAADLGGYDTRCDLREDYELWLRMAARADVANLQVALVDYRLHPGQVTRRRPSTQSLRLVRRAQGELARSLGADPMRSAVDRWLWRASQSGSGQALLRRTTQRRVPA